MLDLRGRVPAKNITSSGIFSGDSLPEKHIKTLLYTGARVTELVNMKLTDVDLQRCQIRIDAGKGDKDRMVPFHERSKEVLAFI